MPVTFGTPSSAFDTTDPYSITLDCTTVVGNLVFAVALAGEWNSDTPGARVLSDPAEPGWNRLYVEEFQIWPGAQPLRRMVCGAWWKVATSTREEATITLTGGALSSRLRGGIVAVEGVTGGYVGQELTRKENPFPAAGSPWSPTIPTIGAGQVGFLIYQVWGSSGYPTPSGEGHTGWSWGPDLSSSPGFSGMLYVEGASPPITWPSQFTSAMVTVAVFGMPGGGWQLGSVGWGPA